MKKVAIGCAIVLAILIVGGGGLAIWGWGKISGMVGELTEFVEDVQQIHEEAPRDPDFQPPEDGIIADEQVDKLVAVETSIRETLAPVLEQHQERYQQLQELLDETGREPNIGELFEGMGDVGAILRGYKRAQVEALKQQQVSLEEYYWIRATAVRNLSQVDVDLSGELSAEQTRLLRRAEIHPENAEKLSEHVELLKETLPWLMLDAMVVGFIGE